MRSKIYIYFIYTDFIWFMISCLASDFNSWCISRDLWMSSNFKETHVYLCDYPLINLLYDAFQTSLNTNPDPCIHLLLFLRQTNLCARGIGGTATISIKHLVTWRTLQTRWRHLINWCLSLNVASVQTFSAHWQHPFIINSAFAGQAKGQRSNSLVNC